MASVHPVMAPSHFVTVPVHVGLMNGYLRMPSLHLRMINVYLRVEYLHLRMAFLHLRKINVFLRMAFLYPGMTVVHSGKAFLHPGATFKVLRSGFSLKRRRFVFRKSKMAAVVSPAGQWRVCGGGWCCESLNSSQSP